MTGSQISFRKMLVVQGSSALMPKSALARFSTRTLVALVCASLAGVVVAPAANAAITNCGTMSYTDSSQGDQSGFLATYDSALGKCKLLFVGDTDGYSYSSTTITNLKLPSFVTSLNVYGVAGGGSTGANMENWVNDYYQNFNTNTVQVSDSGAGGGGGGSFYKTSLAVTSGYTFSLTAGDAGIFDPNRPFGPMYDNYLGQDGGASQFAYNTGSATTTITANGGKSPTLAAMTTGGSGGSVTGTPSTTGWTTNAGTAGLNYNMNNSSPVGSTFITELSGSAIGQGGGSKASGYVGNRGAGYGSGGGGSFVDDGQMFLEDLGCYLVSAGNKCDAQPGAVLLTYSAINYYPVAFEPGSANQLSTGNPYQGSAVTAQYFTDPAVAPDNSGPSPLPTTTYTWYRCTGTSAGSLDSTGAATGCTQVQTGSSASYTPTSADLGSYLQAKIVASNTGTVGGTTTITGYTPTSTEKVVTTPSAPTLTSLYSKTPTKASFTITPSTSWGASYGFKLVNSSTGAEIGSSTYDGTRLNVTGLIANTSYSVKLQQTNAAGSSPSSSTPIAFTTPLAVTPTTAPVITGGDYRVGKTVGYTSAGWTGNGTVTPTVNWYACTSAMSATVAYESSVSISGCTSIASTTTLTLTSTMANKYLYLVETGTDSFSSTQSGAATPKNGATPILITGEMDTPTISSIALVSGSATTARVTLQLPAFTGGSSVITGYRFQTSTNGGLSWSGTSSLTGNSATFDITNLTQGNSYTFKIAVTNSVNSITYISGFDTWSTALIMPRAIGVTAYPVITSSAGSFNVGTTLGISSGTFTGDNPVTVDPLTSGSWVSCDSAKAAASASSFANLVASGCGMVGNGSANTTFSGDGLWISYGNRPHMFVIQKVSDGYASLFVRSASIQLSMAPSSPTAVSVTGASTTSLSVSFSAPALAGGSAINGYKYSYAAGPNYSSWSTPVSTGTVPATSTSFTISGLTSGVSYKVRVYASNGAGPNGYAGSTSVASADSTATPTYFAPTATGAPLISGTASVGEQLSVDRSGFVVSASPATTPSYQWYECSSQADVAGLGGSCTGINGATQGTFTVGSAQSQKYLTVKVTEANVVGTTFAVAASTSQVPGVPGQVTSVLATPTGRTSLTITYTLPSFVGAGPITSVEYQFSAAPYASWSSFAAAPDTSGSFSITGLSENTMYRVIVRANNSSGNGASSAASVAVSTLGNANITGSPTIVGSPVVGQTLTASEENLVFTGTPIPEVSVRHWFACDAEKNVGDPLSGCAQIADAATNEYVVSSTYVSKFLVYSVTAANSSSEITVASASTASVSGVPAAVTISGITLNGSGTVNVTVIAGSTGNSPITGFAYQLDGAGSWITSESGSSTSFAIASLNDGQQYSLSVRALNANGQGPGSTSRTFTSLGFPTGLNATAGDATVSLTWLALAGANTYTVSYSTSAVSGFTNVANCSALTLRTCTVSGLVNGVDYFVRVQATNANGTSPTSEPVGPIKPMNAALTLISNYSGASNAPVLSTYSSLGVAGVTAANLSAINAFIAALPASSTTSVDQIQRIVSAYVAVLAAAANHTYSGVSLTQLRELGITGVDAGNLQAVVSAIAGANPTAISGATNLQSIVTAAINSANTAATSLIAFASAQTTPTTIETYAAAGVVGVSEANKIQIDAALASADPSPTSLEDIQRIVDSVLAPSVASLSSFTSPSSIRLSDFAAAGIAGVSAGNQAAIAGLLATLPASSRDSITEIQATIDSYNFVISIASGGVNASSSSVKPSVEDFEAIGVDLGSLATNPTGFQFFESVLSTLPPANLASPVAISASASIVTKLLGVSAGTIDSSNLTLANFASLGLQGITADNLAEVLLEIRAIGSGPNSTSALQALLLKYKPLPPASIKLVFASNAFKVTPTMAKSINAVVVKLVGQKVKAVVINNKLVFPARTPASTINAAKTLATKQNAATLATVNAKLKALKSKIKAQTKITVVVGTKSQTTVVTGTR